MNIARVKKYSNKDGGTKKEFLLDCLDHCESHVDTVARVLGPRDGKTGDAVVTVAKDLDAHALVVLKIIVILKCARFLN